MIGRLHCGITQAQAAVNAFTVVRPMIGRLPLRLLERARRPARLVRVVRPMIGRLPFAARRFLPLHASKHLSSGR